MTLLKQPELKAEVRGNGLEVDTVLGVVRYEIGRASCRERV